MRTVLGQVDCLNEELEFAPFWHHYQCSSLKLRVPCSVSRAKKSKAVGALKTGDSKAKQPAPAAAPVKAPTSPTAPGIGFLEAGDEHVDHLMHKVLAVQPVKSLPDSIPIVGAIPPYKAVSKFRGHETFKETVAKAPSPPRVAKTVTGTPPPVVAASPLAPGYPPHPRCPTEAEYNQSRVQQSNARAEALATQARSHLNRIEELGGKASSDGSAKPTVYLYYSTQPWQAPGLIPVGTVDLSQVLNHQANSPPAAADPANRNRRPGKEPMYPIPARQTNGAQAGTNISGAGPSTAAAQSSAAPTAPAPTVVAQRAAAPTVDSSMTAVQPAAVPTAPPTSAMVDAAQPSSPAPAVVREAGPATRTRSKTLPGPNTPHRPFLTEEKRQELANKAIQKRKAEQARKASQQALLPK